MTFIWPVMLFTLMIVPFYVWLYGRLFRKRQQAAASLGPLGLSTDRLGRNFGRKRHIPPMLLLLGLTFLLIGLARPEMIVDLPRVEGTVILAFDISNSMAAEDMEPTRMEAAKAAAKTFVENQPATIQIGVVAFSNGGLVVQAPTNDQEAILTTIERLQPQGATSLGQGIFSALNAITGEAIPIDPALIEEGGPLPDIGSYPSSVILLLTDGENTSRPDPFVIAQLAAEAGIRIYPVGIGDPEGTVLEIDGFNILTQLNQAILKEIASMTNGAYYHAADEETLQDIYHNVDLRLAIRGEKMEVTSLSAGFGLLFFLIGGAISLFWYGRMPL